MSEESEREGMCACRFSSVCHACLLVCRKMGLEGDLGCGCGAASFLWTLGDLVGIITIRFGDGVNDGVNTNTKWFRTLLE